MERLMLEQFFNEENIHFEDAKELINLSQAWTRENLTTALNDPSTLSLIERYHTFEEKVHKGHLGKTATFWMTFIEHCHLVFMLLHAVKTNNLELLHKCNGKMAELFFAYDGHNYSSLVYSYILKIMCAYVWIDNNV